MMALKFTVFFCFMATFKIKLIDAFRLDYSYVEPTRSFYKFHRNSANWTDARSTCQSEGALLYYPNNEPELAQVLSVLDVGNITIYVGMSDVGKFGIYETIDGRPISEVYSKWAEGYPHSSRQEACMAVYTPKNNYLYTLKCNSKSSFICKLINPTIEDAVTTAIGGVESIIASVAASLDKQTEAMQRQAENQVAALDRLTQAMQRQGADQTATMIRLALVLEKPASPQKKVRRSMQTRRP